MNVSEMMVSPVVVTQKNKNIDHVRGLFQKKNIRAIPILTMQGEIQGIISSSDVAQISDGTILVESVMSQKTHVVSPDTGIKDAAKMMIKHQVHHLVVMENGQVIGIISSMDVVHLVAQGNLST